MNAVTPIHVAPTTTNPYVGPLPIAAGQPIYGRRREVAELSDLLVSKRIVLLFSPSGAGKTSLIQAALLPTLKGRYRLKPLPIIRLDRFGGAKEATKRVNRYTLATLRTLETLFPEGERLGDEILAEWSLVEYFRDRLGPERAQYAVLVFDQFEELFTTDPIDGRAKTAFLEDLGAVLAGRHTTPCATGDADPEELIYDDHAQGGPGATVWALFSMREDRIAELEPYLHLLPTGLAFRYRIDCLGKDEALEAIVQPAEGSFAKDAAERLVKELRTVVVIGADGREQLRAGRFVDPVQLQVVCRDLWQRIVGEHKRQIVLSDLESLQGGTNEVERALRAYFDASVADAVRISGASERRLRDWLEGNLVSPGGIRTQALMEPGKPEPRIAAALEELLRAHLLRSDTRNDREWRELSHDRLVGPMRAANAAWRLANLEPFQLSATRWVEGRRSRWYLLGASEWIKARSFAALHPDELESVERDFLDASFRQLRQLLAVLALVPLLMFGWSAWTQYQVKTLEQEAREKELEEEARRLFYNNARAAQQRKPQASAIRDLLAAEYKASNKKEYGPGSPEHRFALRLLRETLGGVPEAVEGTLPAHEQLLSSLVFVADGRHLLSSSWDQTLRLVAVDRASVQTSASTALLGSPAYSATAHVGLGLVASTHLDGRVLLWKIQGLDPVRLAEVRHSLAELEGTREGQATSAAFSGDGKTLVTVGWDHKVALWDVSNPAAPVAIPSLAAHRMFIQRVVFLPADGERTGRFVTADVGGIVRFWSLAEVGRDARPQRELVARTPMGNRVGLYSLAVDPTGRYLVAGDAKGMLHVWDLRDIATRDSLVLSREAHLGEGKSQVRDVAFAPDGSEFTSVGLDGYVVRWRLPDEVANLGDLDTRIMIKRHGPFGERLFSVAYRPGTVGHVAVGGTRSGWMVDLRRGDWSVLATSLPAAVAVVPYWRQVSMDGAGKVIGATSKNGQVMLWRRDGGTVAPLGVLGHQAAAFAIAPAGDAVLTVDCHGALNSWPIKAGTQEDFVAMDGGCIPLQKMSRRCYGASGSRTSEAGMPEVAGATEVRCAPLLTLSRDGRMAAIAVGSEVTVWLRDKTGWRVARREKGPDAEVITSLAFDPARRHIAVGMATGWLQLRNLRHDADGTLALETVASRPTGAGAVTAVAFVDDALVTGTENGILKQLSLPSLKQIHTDYRHERQVSTIVVSTIVVPKEAKMAQLFTADLDGRVFQWVRGTLNSETDSVLTPPREILSAAVSNEGDILVTASETEVLVWNLEPGAILAAARRQLPATTSAPESIRPSRPPPQAAARRP